MSQLPNDDWQEYIDKLMTTIISSSGIPTLYTGSPVNQKGVNMSVPDKGISTTGMAGFSEQGVPSEWDMAVGQVYGYRWWKIPVPLGVVGHKGESEDIPTRLMPLTGANNQPWKDGKNEAICTSMNAFPSWSDLIAGRPPVVHEPPEYRVSCGCGFWAYFDKELQVENVMGGMGSPNPYVSGSTAYLPVFGVVKGTGRVIIGTKGFRSQYAEIVGLCVPDRAVEHMSWDISGKKRSSMGLDYYDTVYGALRGGPGWYTSSAPTSHEVVRQASDTERIRRVARVEATLSGAYPSAHILSDQWALTKYFPPDKNYA